MKTILGVAAVFLLLCISTNCSLKASVIAYYRFEEGTNGLQASATNSIIDTSGNGLNGTPVGSVTYTSNVPCNPIPLTGASNLLALAFDGSSGRISVPDNPLLALTNSLTLEAFVYIKAPGGGTYNAGQIIFRGDDRGGLDPYELTLETSNMQFAVTDDNDDVAAINSPITLNQWHHIAGTLNGTNGVMALYLDGILTAQTNTTIRPFGSLTGPNPGVGIGNVQSGNYDEYFDGLIDEARISDSALFPSQFLKPPLISSSLNVRLLPVLILSGTVGASFNIQSLPALGGGTNWTTISTVTLSTSQPYFYVDPGSLTNSQHFYRAIPQ